MFGLFSLSTLALVVLYAWGWVLMLKSGMNAGKSWWSASLWALAWPVSAWKLLNDLWRSKPPVE